MSQINKAKEFAKYFVEENPSFKYEVYDFLNLMISEIEQGESPENELSHFESACADLLEE